MKNKPKRVLAIDFGASSGRAIVGTLADGKITMEENQNIKLSYKSVSMDEGLALMEKTSDFILLDVRRPDEFAAGHIPGAVLFTNELMTKDDAEKLLQNKEQHAHALVAISLLFVIKMLLFPHVKTGGRTQILIF